MRGAGFRCGIKLCGQSLKAKISIPEYFHAMPIIFISQSLSTDF
jgi:hypothetical protein